MNSVPHRPSVYLECAVIGLASRSLQNTDALFREWKALQQILSASRQGKIRLVTCRDDIQSDMILWLNDQGCCVTDTLMAMEAIDDFEEWGLPDQHEVDGYRLFLDYCEQLETIPDLLGDVTTSVEKSADANEYTGNQDTLLFKRLLQGVFLLTGPISGGPCLSEEDLAMLHECLGNLQPWYTGDIWRDLRSTDYSLNWEILKDIFKRYSRQPVFNGPGNQTNRRLFGLLNRAIGLSKKSCPVLPMKPNHVSFIVDMVLRKYGRDERVRLARHILHSIKNNIDYFITVDPEIVQRFHTEKGSIVVDSPYTTLRLQVVTPSEFNTTVLS